MHRKINAPRRTLLNQNLTDKMKYVRNPHKAKQMLTLVHEGNNLYDVTIRYWDESVAWVLSQGTSAEEVEKRALKHKCVYAAVARRIIFGD